MTRCMTIGKKSVAPATSSLFGLMRSLARAWRRRAGRGRSLGALAALDDRVLRDVGLSRDDVRRIEMGEGGPRHDRRMTSYFVSASDR